MQTKTKRRGLIGFFSFLGSIVAGAVLRTIYESAGLPDADVHDKYYVVTGVVADLVSSGTGLAVLEGSSRLMRRKGILQDRALELDDQVNTTEDSWSKIKSYLVPGAKIAGAAVIGMGIGSAAKGVYQACDGPDFDINAGPFVLDGMFSDMLSTASAIAVYKGAVPAYQHFVKPQLAKCGFFKEEKPQVANEHSALMQRSKASQYEMQAPEYQAPQHGLV